MASIVDLFDLGDRFVSTLALKRSVGNRPGNRVVLLAGNQLHWSASGILGVHLCLGRGIQVRKGCLKEGNARPRDRERVVESLGFGLVNGVREGVTELVVGEHHGPLLVRRVSQHCRRRLERGERKHQDVAKGTRIDRHTRGTCAPGDTIDRSRTDTSSGAPSCVIWDSGPLVTENSTLL